MPPPPKPLPYRTACIMMALPDAHVAPIWEILPMLTIRPAAQRGHANHGWLDTFHTFSFAEYRDANHMGFRCLRVINDDRIHPARGFGTHGHRDMEIITYVIEGELEHQDSMGNGSVIKAGDMQYMSAGTGVQHSEKNPSQTSPVHLYQIWIHPDREGHAPRYDQKHYTRVEKLNRLCLVCSADGQAESITIRQDAKVFASILEGSATVTHNMSEGRGAWIQVLSGELLVNGTKLAAGDGLAAEQERALEFVARSPAVEFLLFDLA